MCHFSSVFFLYIHLVKQTHRLSFHSARTFYIYFNIHSHFIPYPSCFFFYFSLRKQNKKKHERNIINLHIKKTILPLHISRKLTASETTITSVKNHRNLENHHVVSFLFIHPYLHNFIIFSHKTKRVYMRRNFEVIFTVLYKLFFFYVSE